MFRWRRGPEAFAVSDQPLSANTTASAAFTAVAARRTSRASAANTIRITRGGFSRAAASRFSISIEECCSKADRSEDE